MDVFRRLGAFFLDIIQVLVFAIALALFLYLLVMQPHKIKGDSMQPNFPDGEYLLTDKVSYRFGEPQRGDIIVFRAPTNNNDEYIKRIIGLPGEIVEIQKGRVFVDGKELSETYLDPTITTDAGAFLAEGESAKVPEDQYFVLGDNRDFSSDSRAWGFVPSDKITGRAWVIYWPPTKAGGIERPFYSF